MKEITEEEFWELSVIDRDVYTGVIRWEDGSCEYYKNGKLHREDGPSIIFFDGVLAYFQNGRRHRIDGPACIDGDFVQFWINGEQVSKEAQELYYMLMKLKELT